MLGRHDPHSKANMSSSSPSPRLTLILFLAALIFIAVGGALLLSRPEPATIIIHPPAPTATPLPTATPAPILVYVSGAVRQPETLHILPFGSRVTDAIAAAGGFTDLANQSLVNLAGILRDGDQVHVPSIYPASDHAALPTPAGGRRVHVNTAGLDELETLPGVGPALAQRIILYREAAGPFKSLDELDNVPGIGQVTLEKLRELVAFD